MARLYVGLARRIAWRRWTDSGYSLLPSAGHIADGGLTLCGARIPGDNFQGEIGNAEDFMADDCKRCDKRAEKLLRSRRAWWE